MSSKHFFSHSAGSLDVVDYETISSADIGVVENPERLHEWLTAAQIELLHRKFITHPEHLLNIHELRQTFESFGITFTDREFKRLFLKINQNRDFKCDWDELLSYLIFGFQEDDPGTQKEALVLPISIPPMIKKSEHRSQICCMTFLKPWLSNENDDEDDQGVATNTDNEGDGMYLTASKEGFIKFWSTAFEAIRSGTSESIHLKMPTWILAIEALSDVSIVCTASTERELRFHETVVSTFSLRLVIRSMPFAVCCMGYTYHPTGAVNSQLVLGDYGGNVRILEFTPILRGPFQSKPGAALVDVMWSDLLKGKIPLIKIREYINIHTELIRQVYYSLKLHFLFTAAEYRNNKKYRGRCNGIVVVSNEEKIFFRIPMGVSTFSVADAKNLFVTGGPDMFVRIWDVYIPTKPIGLLSGHNAGVVKVFVQASEKLVYSIDYHKIVKVWNLYEYTLLQSYGDLVRLLHAETDLVYLYNAKARILAIGGRKLVSLKCCPHIRVDLTDGNTHSQPVSVVLYNKLFRNVVTCGLDSYIIVWDPWTGRRKIIMKNCHTRMIYGQSISIEITAACFDPLDQFLLTGARDGSLKVWSYNNAVCVRNMHITDEHEITAVIWVVERILAVGWDKRVTEFNDVEGREYSDPKKWVQFHDDDITCADVKLGEGVVTATYSGELIFWKLETGQPYRRYKVSMPQKFIELEYNKKLVEEAHAYTSEINVSQFKRISISKNVHDDDDKSGEPQDNEQQSFMPISVQSVLFLQTRPMTKEHGSVFVALDTGAVQVYSHHQRGGYIKQFNAAHKTGDCVLSMTSDRKNQYLFTGTAFGYIKIWHIQNYCIPERDKVRICMPLLRLQFIFLRRERFLTRAKRIVRYQPEPMLLSSYKAHLKAVNSLAYIHLPKILMSGSHDCSCRLWTLGGRYLGTLGTPLPWIKLSPFNAVNEDQEYRMPPDIKKVASTTTIKVISGVQDDNYYKNITKDKKQEDTAGEDDEEITKLYGKPLKEPILGKYFNLPGKSAAEQRVDLDTSLSYIPVYSHLKIHEAQAIERSATPPVLQRVAAEEYVEFFDPPDFKGNKVENPLDDKKHKVNMKLKRTSKDSNDK